MIAVFQVYCKKKVPKKNQVFFFLIIFNHGEFGGDGFNP